MAQPTFMLVCSLAPRWPSWVNDGCAGICGRRKWGREAEARLLAARNYQSDRFEACGQWGVEQGRTATAAGSCP